MRRKAVVLVMVVGILLCVPAAYAHENHEPNPATKLGRGATNILTGWIEIPKQIYLTSKEYDPFTGLVFGSVKGACYAVLRTGTGVFDTTFFVLPPYTSPLMEPEFVFEEW